MHQQTERDLVDLKGADFEGTGFEGDADAASAADLSTGRNDAHDAEEERSSRATAVSELFREHNRTLVRFLDARLQNEQEAREIAQEAYVRLLELGRTGAVGFLRAYLFRIAFNLAIDRVRSRKSRSRLDAAKLQPVEDVFEQTLLEQQVLAADEVRVLRASLEELPEYERQALLMNRLEGLSTAEIGRRLGKSERMVRRYIVHALIYCRHRVEGLSAADARQHMDV